MLFKIEATSGGSKQGFRCQNANFVELPKVSSRRRKREMALWDASETVMMAWLKSRRQGCQKYAKSKNWISFLELWIICFPFDWPLWNLYHIGILSELFNGPNPPGRISRCSFESFEVEYWFSIEWWSIWGRKLLPRLKIGLGDVNNIPICSFLRSFEKSFLTDRSIRFTIEKDVCSFQQFFQTIFCRGRAGQGTRSKKVWHSVGMLLQS